jgi:hypothetical protein
VLPASHPASKHESSTATAWGFTRQVYRWFPFNAFLAFLDRILAHAAGRPLADDVTILLIERSLGT